ncbi:RNA polymerase sigma factor [Dokdonella sp.]|uniref:RNA polymerase sigma factor n=1 Tax=Dokdonella sp. TaxID=2291710 RepID=UPI003C48DA78
MNEALQGRMESGRESDEACERRWIRSIAQGDRSAFEQLYLSYHAPLNRFLMHSTDRRDLVDDVINETLWAVWRGASRFRGDSKPRTWIVSIAYRTLMKFLRDRPPEENRGVRVAFEGEVLGAIADESSSPEHREQRDWLGHGLSLLPDDQRRTIELAYLLGQSCEEIAEIMDCPIGTVKARMFRARVRLRNTLPRIAGDIGPEASMESS